MSITEIVLSVQGPDALTNTLDFSFICLEDFLLVDFVTISHIPFSFFVFITFVFVRITALLFFASNALSITSLASSTLQSEYSKPTLNFSFNGFCILVLLSLIFFEGAKYFLLAI